MQIIQPTLSPNNQSTEGLNNLLEDIDNKIMSLALKEYLNITLGYTDYVDMGLYETLCTYREILLDRLLGCNCLEKEFVVYITSRIQKLTNTFC